MSEQNIKIEETGKADEEALNSPIKKENDGETKDDAYAYLDRGEFTSELFKIEIKNMPKYYGISELRKLINNKLNLNSNKIKTPKRNSSYGFVCFRSEEEREKAIEAINNYTWKGSTLVAIKAKPSPDPLVRKRKDESNNETDCKKFKRDDRTQEERLKDSTTPYWNVEYEEQLKLKQKHLKGIMEKLGKNLASLNPELKSWIEEQKLVNDNLPCKLLDLRFSEKYNNYRNKCEFSIGIDEETQLPTVGFRIGSYVNGTTAVGPIENLKHIPEQMQLAVKIFQQFVRDSSLKVFNHEFQSGHFRQLTARTAVNDQLMLVVGIHPQDLAEDKIKQFKKELIKFFTTGAGAEAKVTSLYYQKIVKRNPGESTQAAEHLWGETHIHETLLGLSFRISPEAFFQVNSNGAEMLYNSVIELADPTPDSTILDVCCGTGTIGLCFANKCSQVLGLELVPQAIEDAKVNATNNNITNSEFFVGKAEEILGSVCYKATNSDVIAIVDPPRAGLQHKAILHLRRISKIKKLVFVSCNPQAALQNFIDFGRAESKLYHGDPFVPVSAVGVDLFPHTKHCELIVCFERWSAVLERSNVK